MLAQARPPMMNHLTSCIHVESFLVHILQGQHKELYFDLKTDRLEDIIPKILPIIVFFYIPNDLP